MKITVFTSNKYRHNYLINKLSEICDSLYVIQECTPYEFDLLIHIIENQNFKNYL